MDRTQQKQIEAWGGYTVGPPPLPKAEVDPEAHVPGAPIRAYIRRSKARGYALAKCYGVTFTVVGTVNRACADFYTITLERIKRRNAR
jgi:hypothetical protein